MLIPFDDYPYHLSSTPFGDAGTSDLRLFDRYWWAVYDPENRVHVNAGMGLYKNMDTLDGFGSVAHEGYQYNVRVSRRLRPDWETLGAGPYRQEVIRPMQTHRLVLEENEYDIAYDLLWEASDKPFEEAPHVAIERGWLEKDYRRFYQFGTATGWVRVNGETFETGDKPWWAFRDHSFGVRPGMGGKMPTRGPGTAEGIGSTEALLVGFALKTTDWAGVWQTNERADGTAFYVDGNLFSHGGRHIKIVKVEHDIEFEPGSLSFARGRFRLTDSFGEVHTMEAERFTAYVYQGYGYIDGYWDKAGLGAYRGDLLVEGDRYDLRNVAKPVDESGHHDFSRMQLLQTPCRIVFDGKPGLADCAAFILPLYERYAST